MSGLPLSAADGVYSFRRFSDFQKNLFFLQHFCISITLINRNPKIYRYSTKALLWRERDESMKPDTQILVAQAKRGDTHAFAQLYEEIYQDLYRFAFCTMKHAEQAEDVVSAAVLQGFEQIHKLRKNTSFRSWMFQITANECRKQFRKQASLVSYEDQKLPEEAANSMNLAEQLALKEAFDTLGEMERLIIALNLFAGYNSREIAKRLHQKEGTVRSIKSRALHKMKQFLT